MAETEMPPLEYLDGFLSHFSSEALPGALPVGQNSPQVCPYGLYAEQLSGSPFTAPRSKNFRTWLYRIRPSVCHSQLSPIDVTLPANEMPIDVFVADPRQLRWNPMTLLDSSQSSETVDFLSGLVPICGAGDPSLKEGLCIYNYVANTSMGNKAMYNSDGDFLIVPQVGALVIRTELGLIRVEPQEIAVIQRGIKFSVAITESSRGYVLEIFKGHFELPNLGPIGSNGLANPRDFQTPVAAFEDIDVEFLIINKFSGKFFQAHMNHSPFDTVAWHGLDFLMNHLPTNLGLICDLLLY